MQLTFRQTLSELAETVVRGARRASGRSAYSSYVWQRPTVRRRVRRRRRAARLALAAAAVYILVTALSAFINAGGVEIRPELEMPCVPVYFYQEDPAWASDTMGRAGVTLGKYGDDVCCLASVLAMREEALPFEGEVNPGTLNAWLTAHGGYSGKGELRWERVARLLGLRLIHRRPGGILTREVDKLLQQGGAAVVRVRRPDVKRDHLVLLVGSVHGEYTIMDPLDPTGTLNTLGLYANRVYDLMYFR